jgi:hypothetical protein
MPDAKFISRPTPARRIKEGTTSKDIQGEKGDDGTHDRNT